MMESLRILYVDDDVLASRFMKRILADAREADVSFARCGSEAVEVLEKERFDVVLSDFLMPGMDGVDLLEEVLRLQPWARRMLFTATPDAVRVQAARRAKLAHRVLPKPSTAAEIREALGVEAGPRSPTPRGTPMI